MKKRQIFVILFIAIFLNLLLITSCSKKYDISDSAKQTIENYMLKIKSGTKNNLSQEIANLQKKSNITDDEKQVYVKLFDYYGQSLLVKQRLLEFEQIDMTLQLVTSFPDDMFLYAIKQLVEKGSGNENLDNALKDVINSNSSVDEIREEFKNKTIKEFELDKNLQEQQKELEKIEKELNTMLK